MTKKSRGGAFCILACCFLLLGACGSQPKLRGAHVTVGDKTYLFVSYSEDLPQAFNDSFLQKEGGDIWYRVDFTTSKIQFQTNKPREFDLSSNTNIGVVASTGDKVLRLGPITNQSTVKVLDGSLRVERRITYNPTMGPVDIFFRVAMDAKYETASSGGGPKAFRGSLEMRAIDIYVDTIGP